MKNNHRVVKFIRSRLFLIILHILIFLAVFILFYHNNLIYRDKNYYAVFLTNDQIYFGQIAKNTGNFMKLNNVYYLQQASTSAKTSTAKQVSVTRLESEFHKPVNGMIINKDQILYYEKLQVNSQVLKAIQEAAK